MQRRTEPIDEYAPVWGLWTPGACLMELEGYSVYDAKARDGARGCVALRRATDEAASRMVTIMRALSNVTGCPNLVETRRVECVRRAEGTDVLSYTESVRPLVAEFNVRPPTENEIARVGVDVCQALIELEKRRLTHLAVAPENLYVSPGGVYKLDAPARLLDQDRAGRACGTVYYLAPEQWRGEHCDARADVYALALTLVRLLGGDEGDRLASFDARMAGTPVPRPPQTSDLMWEALEAACAYDPEARSSLEAFHEALLSAYVGRKPRAKREAPDAPKERANPFRSHIRGVPEPPPREPVPAAPRARKEEQPEEDDAEPRARRLLVKLGVLLAVLAALAGGAYWLLQQSFAEPVAKALGDAWTWLQPKLAEFFSFQWLDGLKELFGGK